MQRTSLHFNPSKYNIRKYKNKWVSCQKKRNLSSDHVIICGTSGTYKDLGSFKSECLSSFYQSEILLQFITTTRWEKLMGMYRIEKWIRSASLYIEHNRRQSNLDRSIFNAKFKSTFCTIIHFGIQSHISCPQQCQNSTKRNLKFL